MREVVLCSATRLRVPAGFEVATVEQVLDLMQRR
jgi:hypothetical protein